MKKKKEGSRSAGFLAFLWREVSRQRESGHIGVANNYTSAGRSFRRFLALRLADDVSFRQLTPTLVCDYEAWLLSAGLCRNTCSFYARSLQSVYHKAVRRGLTGDGAPFRDVYRGVARTVKRAVPPEEIRRISSFDVGRALAGCGRCPGRPGFERRRRALEFARDMFVFCFCARGLTFVDLAFMRKTDIAGGVLTYVRRKTQRPIEVRVEPLMQAVIDRWPSATPYLFPILPPHPGADRLYRSYRYALARHNRMLRELGDMLGGLRLTSYVCRHSWATAARRCGVPLTVISQSMGHESERTTEIYLKSLDCSVIHEANSELLSNVFKRS